MSIGPPGVACLFLGDEAGLADEGIGEGRFAVIDMCDDGHIPDVVLVVHDLTYLFYSELDHCQFVFVYFL